MKLNSIKTSVNITTSRTHDTKRGGTWNNPAYLDMLHECLNNRKNIYPHILLEDQRKYLTTKYPKIDPQLIDKAIATDRRNAEKLIYGLTTGVIKNLDNPRTALAAVMDLDPFAKQTKKSESELAYDQQVKQAKEISPKYWQWVLRTRKLNPKQQYDEGWFHYLDDSGLTLQEILAKKPEEIAAESERWHHEQFAQQENSGTYTSTLSDGIQVADNYWFVPVTAPEAQVEGAKMGNCIGKHVKPSENTKIFSLRNKFNNPHVSISIVDGKIREIKGKQNQIPIEKYTPYILKFIDQITKDGKITTGNSNDLFRLKGIPENKIVEYLAKADDPLSIIIYTKIDDKYPEVMNEVFAAMTPEQLEITINDDAWMQFITKLDPELLYNRIIRGDFGSASSFTTKVYYTLKSGIFSKEQAKNIAIENQAYELTYLAIYEPDRVLGIYNEMGAKRIFGEYVSNNIFKDAFTSYKGPKDKIFYDLIIELANNTTITGYMNRSPRDPSGSNSIDYTDAKNLLRACMKFIPLKYVPSMVGNKAIINLLLTNRTRTSAGAVYAIVDNAPISAILQLTQTTNVLSSNLNIKLQFINLLPERDELADILLLDPMDIFKLVTTSPKEDQPTIVRALSDKIPAENLGNVIEFISDNEPDNQNSKDRIYELILKADTLDELAKLKPYAKGKLKTLYIQKLNRLQRLPNA